MSCCIKKVSEVVQQLGGLCEEFMLYSLYYSEIIKTNVDLVKNPFVVPVENIADCTQDGIIDLQNDSGAHIYVHQDSLPFST